MKNNENKTILIIDDSIDNQSLLTLLLTSKGYRVHCASNGQEALEVLQQLALLPNLILLDAQMPIMDGYAFRVAQTQLEKICEIPVLVMTGDDDTFMNQKMLAPCGVLIKPLQINLLIDQVQSCCSSR